MYGIAATWTADKSHIAYAKGTEMRLVRERWDRVADVAHGARHPVRSARVTRRRAVALHGPRREDGAFTIWEAGADGSNPHPLLPGWTGAQNPCCGTWTADGRYYVFEADGNLWARSEAGGLFRRASSDPVQLTFGPLRFSGVMPSRDGKRLFA
jgi:hypothetical protein